VTARTDPGPTVTLVLTESDRQLVLMALAALSLEKPEWDEDLNRLALRFENAHGDPPRAGLYDELRKMRAAALEDGKRGTP
jgi:hypothetical protein